MIKWCNSIEYRQVIGLDKLVTFGLEIEFVQARRICVTENLKNLFDTKQLSKPWNVKVDETLYEGNITNSPYSGEAVSDILTDDKKTWEDLKLVCDLIKKYRGITSERCGAHIHIGSNVLEDNLKYYIRLAKLWTIYEDVIIKYSYGEDDCVRESSFYYAASNIKLFKHISYFEDGKRDFNTFVNAYSQFKNLAISLRNLDPKRKLNTIEIRCPNGTLNPIIWQNNVNFFTKLLLTCKNDNKDWDYISKKFEMFNDGDIDVLEEEKALELVDFVFENRLDKINFLKQYSKDISVSSKVYQR